MSGIHRRRRSLGRGTAGALGLIAIVAGMGLLASMWLYTNHASAAAARLDRQAAGWGTRALRATGPGKAASSCAAPAVSSVAAGRLRMILAVPALHLTAPVLAGTGDASLNVGVGHLDSSRWPDQGGTSVLEAHDVTFFENIDRLRAGDVIRLTAPCRSWVYRVTSGKVVSQGTPVAASVAPRLVLVTCWPTNALFFTDKRYVVSAALIASGTAQPTLGPQARTTPLAPALPAGLLAQDLSVDRFGVPLGRLHIAGATSASWRQSPAPLEASDAGTRLYDAALLSLRTKQAAWWRVLAPGLAPGVAGALAADPRPVYLSPMDVTVVGDGARTVAVNLEARVETAGRRCSLLVNERVRTDQLVISGWHANCS